MSEKSTITRNDSFADGSTIDIDELDALLYDDAELDRAAVNEMAGAEQYDMTPLSVDMPHATVVTHELQGDSDTSDEIETKVRLRNGIGAAATYRYWTTRLSMADRAERTAAQLKKFESKFDDSRTKKVGKAIARTALKSKLLLASAPGLGLVYMATRDAGMTMSAVTENFNYMPTARSFDNVLIAAGGAGQGHLDITPELRQKGYENGVNIQAVPVEYSAEIGPVVGSESMESSSQGGYIDMMNKYDALVDDGQPAHLVGYSEGSLVVQKAAWDIWNANGGSYPEGTKVTVIGSPFSTTGIGNGALGEIADPVLDAMGIPLDRKLPPGTEIVYYDSDPYANGGNNLPTTVAFDFIGGLALGAHGIPDLNKAPDYVFTDEDGVVHKVYSSDQMLVGAIETALNMKLNNTEAAVNAINAFFPHAALPGQEVQPDIRAGLMYSAEAADYQIDPSGNTRIMRDLVENMPEEWKELGQRGFDGFNTITQTVADIQNGRIDPLTGAQKIMQEMGNIMGGTQDVMNGDPIQSGLQMGIDSLSSLVKQYTGIDISPQANAFVESWTQNGGNYQANATVNANIATLPTNEIDKLFESITKPLQDSWNQNHAALPGSPAAPTLPNLEIPKIELPVPTLAPEPISVPAVTHEQTPVVPRPAGEYVPPVVQPEVVVPEPVPAPEPAAPAPLPEVAAPAPAPAIPNPLGNIPIFGPLFGGGGGNNLMPSPTAEVHNDVGVNLSPLPTLETAGSSSSSANLSGM